MLMKDVWRKGFANMDSIRIPRFIKENKKLKKKENTLSAKKERFKKNND